MQSTIQFFVQTHTEPRWTGIRWQLQSRTVPQIQESARPSHQDGTHQNSAKQHKMYEGRSENKVVAAVTLWETHDTHHGNSLRLNHLFGRDGGEVGQVGEDVHHRHYRHGYDDGQRQVPVAGRGQRSFEERTFNIFFYSYMIVFTAFMRTGIVSVMLDCISIKNIYASHAFLRMLIFQVFEAAIVLDCI